MSTPIATGISLVSPPNGWNINGMYFDAWLRQYHNSSMTITQHPVESGANISDHCFLNPLRFNFELGVSDSTVKSLADLFNLTNYLPGGPSRSINAYTKLVGLQGTRELLTLTSKYGSYNNVLIDSIDVSDDWTTKNAMKATVSMVQVILADTETFQVSANPQATDQTSRGNLSPVPALGTWERIQYDQNNFLQILKQVHL